MTPSTPLLRVHGLRFAYPGEPALFSGADLEVGPGITQLFGDTGSGKSTLLRLLAGDPAAVRTGRLALNEIDLDRDPVGYRSQVFFADPASDRFDAMSVHDCTAALDAGDAKVDRAAWQSLVEGFGLLPHLGKHMYMLSTGSRRKVALASALASGRALVLLDDPTAALDAGSVRCLWTALARRASQPGSAVVIASAERIEAIPLAASIALPLR